jgi:hypothetical protein
MTTMTRNFTAVPAERHAEHLYLGIVGPSSSGKTYSALELATGIQSVMGGEIALIDTENGRGRAYADEFRKPDGSPGYHYVQFDPPFGSLDYVEALKFAAKLVGPGGTVIVDSMSHEHESEGGMLDYWDQEMRRLARDDYGTAKAERFNMLAWAKPKAARRQLLQTITRLNCNVIMCFRAKNTSKPGKEKFTRPDGSEGSKNVVLPMGFIPIAGDEFVYEMSLSVLLPPNSQGVPNWAPEFPGERMAVKVPKQFEWIAQLKGPLSRDVGKRLATWAKGSPTPGGAKPKAAPKPATTSPPAQTFTPDLAEPNDWADRLEDTIKFAENADTLKADYATAANSEEMAQLIERDRARAEKIKSAATARLKELRTTGAPA